MAHIAITTQLHPCTNPRPVKEANALVAAGHRVSYVTALFDSSLDQSDQAVLDPRVELIPAVDLRTGRSTSTQRFTAKLRRRIATELVSRFKFDTTAALCQSPGKLVSCAAALDADLYIGHIEAGIYTALEMIKQGRKAAFDFEDWHSRDGLPAAQRRFPTRLVSRLEHEALNKGAYVSTTSAPLAKALADAAGSEMPEVLYNVFPFSERDTPLVVQPDRVDPSKPSLAWFSQTVGPGRGIENIVNALKLIDRPVELHLRGKLRADFQTWLDANFPTSKGHTVHIHPLIPHRQLMPTLMQHDIGLATELSTPPSRDLTLSNKIFQYLQAGLAVIASDTAGQRSLAEKCTPAIKIIPQDAAPEAARAIESWLSDPHAIAAAKQKALELAEKKYAWEIESVKFLHLVEQALK